MVRDVADLYDLKPEQVAVLPRLGEKSAANIMESLLRSREVPFARVLYALGIRFVGETTARNLAAHFRSLDAVMAASQEELAQAEEVGDKIAGSIREYFADPVNLRIVERLRAAGVQFAADEEQRLSDSLAGLHIVISGTFRRHSRDELKALIESHGGRNLAAVSKKCGLSARRRQHGACETGQGHEARCTDNFRRGFRAHGGRRGGEDGRRETYGKWGTHRWYCSGYGRNGPTITVLIFALSLFYGYFNLFIFTFCLYIFDGIKKKYLYLPDEREGLPVGQMSIR